MPELPGRPAASGPSPGAAVSLADLQEAHGGAPLRWLRVVNQVLHTLAGLTLVGLLAWTAVDIVGRSAFSSPLRGTIELTELAVVVLVYLGLARTETDDAHITVDLLFVRFKRRGQLVLRAVAGAIGVAVIAVMTWRLYQFTGHLQAGGYETSRLRVPLWPVAVLGVVGATAFGLSVLANLLVVLRALAKDR